MHYVQTKRNLSLFRKKVFMSFDSIKAAEKKTTEYNVRSSMANGKCVNFTQNDAMAGILYVCFKSIINILKKFFILKILHIEKICNLFIALYL